MLSRDCWHACGPWDESFFLYSEEADFDLRARDAGFATVYEPSAGAVHLEGDSGNSPQLWTLLQLNRVRHFRRRHALVPAVGILVRDRSSGGESRHARQGPKPSSTRCTAEHQTAAGGARRTSVAPKLSNA